MQITIRIPDEIIKEADQYVDNIHYRSRAHLITVALADWLEERREEEEFEEEYGEDEEDDDGELLS